MRRHTCAYQAVNVSFSENFECVLNGRYIDRTTPVLYLLLLTFSVIRKKNNNHANEMEKINLDYE